tara:strand:- start:1298 stop:1621 length:324 start_codon:yes stop_codon:yes gene_type:complete
MNEKQFIKTTNLTPHDLVVNDHWIPASGEVARVTQGFSEIIDGVCQQTFGEIEGLPDPQEGVRFIVSGLVFAATDRPDVFAPATGHPGVIRNQAGHIVSVPCLVGRV